MKKVFSLLLCAAALFALTSCESSNDNDNEGGNAGDGSTTSGTSLLYVLNSGKYGSNNASITSYDFETQTTVESLFSSVNGQGLGDTAQDILLFGENIYITVYGSGVIFVTDLAGNIVEEISNTTYFMPRYLTSDGDYVYVSYYDGGVAKINPETFEVTAAAVSINPEQIVASNGKLYVTISQGYGNYNDCNTIDVYNTSSMTFEKSIEVVLNPTQVTADSEGNLYVLSMGNYGYGDPAIYATLQKVDVTTEESTTLTVSGVDGAVISAMTMGKDDVLYVIEGISDASTNWTMVGDVYAYDTTTGEASQFITDGTSISDMYSISADKTSGEVYVGTSDYTNTGDMYVLNSDGTLKATVGVGMNPMKGISVEVEE